jgi:hypothetical protein
MADPGLMKFVMALMGLPHQFSNQRVLKFYIFS